MHSGMIGKVAKAHRYVKERERFEVESLSVTIHGDNADHHVEFVDGCLQRCFRPPRRRLRWRRSRPSGR